MTERDPYVTQDARRTWERLANIHIDAGRPTGALARALLTLIDAYRDLAQMGTE
jgi:hypothetical protein